ncbi:MAG TPA: peptidylprolyl isomerase [Xanthomonadaceae bacterium]|nr:peptidylprolyl isomerase [Xanthomonadaceae bacterium]
MNRLLSGLFVLAASFSASSWPAPAQAQQLQSVERIAAVVDEDVILRSELDRALANVISQYAGRQEQLPPRDVLEKQVLERLILIRLQVARASSTGVRVSDQEVDAAVANIAQQGGVGEQQLRQQLTRDGVSFTDFRASVRDELTVQRLRQRFAQGRIVVSDAEVDAALAAQAATGTQYRLSHILVGVPDAATPEQIAKGQQKIDGIKALIDKREIDFAAAAVRYSDSPNALEGGDLGWRSLDEIPTAFAEPVRGLSPGQVVGPIRGPSGFQLLRLVEVRDAALAGPRLVTQYQARHILMRIDEDTSETQAKARIDTLRARLTGGADFVAVARESSEDLNTKGTGGDLGWFAQDAFGPEFGAQVAGLADGQVSAPFRTEAGWHVVQRIGSRQADVANDSQRSQVRETIGRRKLEDDYARFLRELRGEAFIDLRAGAGTTPATTPGG